MRLVKLSALCAVCLLAPQTAFAHVGAGQPSGFLPGLLHPFTGIDHILAMVLVGLFAVQLGGRAVWLVPSAFLVAMSLGGVLGFAGIGVPMVEVGIALSVVVLGAAVALAAKLPTAAALAMAAVFAMFHGHAHGAEMPADATSAGYALGFIAATFLLHTAGIGLGFAFGRSAVGRNGLSTRITGAVSSCIGVILLANAV